jgi:hypothetical protein
VVYDAHSAAFRAQLAAGLLNADAIASLPVHATQMYEALFALLVAAAVPWLRRVVRRDGSLILGVLLLLSVGRMVLEFFRARELAAFMGLTEVQWLLTGLAAAIGLLLVHRERAAVNDVAPHRSSRASWMRIACVAAVPVVLLIASGSTFALIERLALVSAALPPLLALAERSSLLGARRSRLGWRRLPVSLAMVAVVLQQPEGDLSPRPESGPGYPRTDWSAGISYGEQHDQVRRVVGEEWVEGCSGPYLRDNTEEFRLHYRLVGSNVARTRRTDADRATTIRLMGFAGSETASNSADQTTTTDLGGVGTAITLDWRLVGTSGGVAFGRFAEGSRGRAILGVRVGSLTGFHGRIGHNDVEPQGGAESTTHAGVGYAFGTSGWAVRGGREFQDDRSFLGATLPFRNLLIEPTVFLPDDRSLSESKPELRITATYRFPGRALRADPDLR